MILGFDSKRLFHNKTGLGTYSRLLVKGIHDAFPEENLVLFAQNAHQSPFQEDFSQLKTVGSSLPLWRSWGMRNSICEEGCDIFHGLSNELPLGIEKLKIRTLVTIHDVIFKVDPQLYPWLDRKIYDFKWKHSCRVADKVVAVSDHTRQDLCRYYGLHEEKIVVLAPPVATSETNLNLDEVRKHYHLPDQFFLYVGALTRRKNVISILKALNRLKSADRVPVMIIGAGPEKKALEDYIRESGLTNTAYFLGYVPTVHLPAIYKMAYALIYPSFYEGFGIPIVEALRQRTPVITSNTSAMPESAGPGGLLINPTDPDDLADAMLRILEDSNLHQQLSEAGYWHSLKYSPETICKEQMEIYREMANV